ncbi:MAG: thiamine phosphate synthase [Legionella longbeachae]|nr:thiamine phosphate synthase [Legionella longbeachae]
MHRIWTNVENDADLQTYRGLGVVPQSQINAATLDAIKIDLSVLENTPGIEGILKNCSCPVVFDLALPCSLDFDEPKRKKLIRLISIAQILVLDSYVTEFLLNCNITTTQSIQEAASELLHFGAKSILLLGKQARENLWIHDYCTNGDSSFWLTQTRNAAAKYPEIRSVLTAAITGALALEHPPHDAIIIGKMYAHQALRRANTTLYYGEFPENEADLPYLSSLPIQQAPQPFRRCSHLGLYPIVDSPDWVEMLVKLGVKTIQLRIKEQTKNLEEDIRRSIALAKKHQVLLFINDYWELALKLNAEAVHLGQTDLDAADIDLIRHQGLLLGVSTHCYYEVSRAHAICPSYIAIGPVYPTSSKKMPFVAQGIERLYRWQRTLNYPLVAIGGINFERMSAVLASGVQGVALISALTKAEDPQRVTKQLLGFIDNYEN